MLVNLLADEDESDDEDDKIPRRPKTLRISSDYESLYNRNEHFCLVEN